MKLTNKQLKQIIKEELGRVLYENPDRMAKLFASLEGMVSFYGELYSAYPEEYEDLFRSALDFADNWDLPIQLVKSEDYETAEEILFDPYDEYHDNLIGYDIDSDDQYDFAVAVVKILKHQI